MLQSIQDFFKKLKPQQQKQLLLIVCGTLLAAVGLYYALIRTQMAQVKAQKESAAEFEDKIEKATRLVQMSDSYKKEYEDMNATLTRIEDSLAPPNSDLYAWMFKLVTKFQEGGKVEVLHVTREQPCEVGVFPLFPYKAIPASVDGQGQYHEIGKYIADFENQYPYFRVQNLDLRPVGSTQAGEENAKLSFKMEIVALIAKSADSN